ncbi:asparagine synthase (glutamine-hydrolyzing) [Rhodopseudomonas sp. P1]|uniref:asparagine synthase (glutamine-hydrolyzing) n=1 Tax=Rhodopseudomonas sp. P1 TaxID=3434357 RepID=UPI0031FDDA11
MCGIAGILSKTGVGDDADLLDRMLGAMVHRGPDGQGTYLGDRAAIGMRRLSIIDLTGGWQPLYNEDKSLALVANGEIYNFVELTQELIARGHRFSTHSDCEVILHLYEEEQENCLRHLRGMFAFALVDIKRGTVFIARDRMGEKPLYLHETQDSLLFASEMKSLLSSGRVPFELDPGSVNDYFHYQYVPEPRTPLRAVRKLPRAHYLKVDLASWKVEQHKYWDMEDAPPVEGDPSELVRAELEKISELLIRADVPVGVALSGGLDSSAIAALAARKYPGTMHAFSVGYPGRPPNDERNNAKALADLLGMPFHEIELTTPELVAHFEQMNFERDDPIADISGFGYYSVNKAARAQGIPVLLQGQGGDEIFWGYEWVKDAALATDNMQNPGSQRREPFNLKRFVKTSLRRLSGAHRPAPASVPKAAGHRPIFHELAPDFRMALTDLRSNFTGRFIEQLGSASAYDFFTFDKPWKQSDILITRLISDTYLLENGIAQGDRLSMTNSVELRLPFVDYKLVELVIGLRKTHASDPDYLRFPKPWLRGAMQGILPEFIIDRPKQGFAPPLMEWHNALFKAYGHYLDGGYLVQSGVLTEQAGAELSAGPFPRGAIAPISFKALVLEIWCREMTKLVTPSVG